MAARPGRLRRRTSSERLPIAVEEDLLAADAAQHAEAGDRVGAERRQPADLLALLALAFLERLDHERQAGDQERDADEHDDAEQRRRREQHRRDDEVGSDRPASRAVMSYAPPARSASFETVATTSPVVRRVRIAGPVRAAWCATTWIIRKLACSQLLTAARCRSVPATAWMTPSPRSAPAQASSTPSRLSRCPRRWRGRGPTAAAPARASRRSRRSCRARACRPGGARPKAGTASANACRACPGRRREAASSARQCMRRAGEIGHDESVAERTPSR